MASAAARFMSGPGAFINGRYKLLRELGVGGHARVFEATDVKIGRTVAVKIVSLSAPTATSADHQSRLDEATQRLDREGRIGASLVHTNICAVTDVDRHDETGMPFIVMERLSGETLATRLEHHPLAKITSSGLPTHADHTLAMSIATQLLSGLEVAHAAGVIHRDIKPGNIFLVDHDLGTKDTLLVKLIDFGIAQVPGMPILDGAALTRQGFVVGTPEYMSPEQVRGNRDFDSRSDVYSAAVLIHELLTGVRPFHGLTMAASLEAIAFKKPAPIRTVAPNLSPILARAIDAALSVDRARRPPTAGAFLNMLRGKEDGGMIVNTAVTHVFSEPGGVSGSGSGPIPTLVSKTLDNNEDDWDMPTQQKPPPIDDGRS